MGVLGQFGTVLVRAGDDDFPIASQLGTPHTARTSVDSCFLLYWLYPPASDPFASTVVWDSWSRKAMADHLLVVRGWTNGSRTIYFTNAQCF